ncbi:MAG: nitroreductase [Acidimicrobiales bacterium]|nr:nitroreductase [Acidimicrobiales bacterium]
MELRDVMRSTPATRDFTDEPVSDEELHALLDVARFAPSGGNRQGWQVIVLKDPEVRRRIRDLYVLSWREYMAHVNKGLVAFAPIDNGRWNGPAVDLEQARNTPAPMPFADHLHEVPVLLVLVVELAALAVLDNGLDRQSIVGGGSVYPFGHNILLAARDAGLGGVMTTALARQEPAVKELLGIPDGFAIAGLLALGHPAKEVTKLRRDPVEAFTTVDRFDGRPFP